MTGGAEWRCTRHICSHCPEPRCQAARQQIPTLVLVSTQDGAGDTHTTQVDGLGQLQATVPALECTHAVLVRKLAGGGGKAGQGLGGVNVYTGELLEVTACGRQQHKAMGQQSSRGMPHQVCVLHHSLLIGVCSHAVPIVSDCVLLALWPIIQPKAAVVCSTNCWVNAS